MVRKTSIEAYRKIKDGKLLTQKRQIIYDCLFEHGPLTGNEIFRKTQGYTTIVHANVHSKLNCMEKLGVVERIGIRKCSVTGMNVDLWDVTGRLPAKPPKPHRVDCPHCNGTGYIEKQQMELDL